MNRKRDLAIVGFVIVALLGVFIFQNVQLTGKASRNVQTTLELDIDEYLFIVGERKIIDGVGIILIEVTESNEVIVDVSGIRKSVNEYGGRVINNVQIESRSVSSDGAILKVLNLGKMEASCVDSDDGDIFVKGKCDDRFYADGVEDFCDFNNLKEYNCGYDAYVDEVHCLKHVVECSDGCRNGACVVK